MRRSFVWLGPVSALLWILGCSSTDNANGQGGASTTSSGSGGTDAGGTGGGGGSQQGGAGEASDGGSAVGGAGGEATNEDAVDTYCSAQAAACCDPQEEDCDAAQAECISGVSDMRDALTEECQVLMDAYLLCIKEDCNADADNPALGCEDEHDDFLACVTSGV